MSFHDIEYEVVNQVARITTARPEYRNAQSRRLLEELDEAFAMAGCDQDVHVIALFGSRWQDVIRTYTLLRYSGKAITFQGVTIWAHQTNEKICRSDRYRKVCVAVSITRGSSSLKNRCVGATSRNLRSREFKAIAYSVDGLSPVLWTSFTQLIARCF